jgi:NADH-quinone oxidoreductase subunit E
MSTLSAPVDEARRFEAACEVLEQYHHDPAKLVPILQATQEIYRYLPEDVMAYIATALGIPAARVYGVASFYAHFTLKPKGKYVVKLCDGTACHVKGTPKLLSAVRERLGLREDQDTTPDMLITVETVSCLGACGLAPVMMINEAVHGQLSADDAVELVEELLEEAE